MNKAVAACALIFYASFTYAAGKLNHLEVDQDIVIFTTTETKNSVPNCVTPENTQYWSISLATEQGRYQYGMLMTAMSAGVPIDVTSAEDCDAAANVERAQKIKMTHE